MKFLQNLSGINYGTISAFHKILTDITTDSSAGYTEKSCRRLNPVDIVRKLFSA